MPGEPKTASTLIRPFLSAVYDAQAQGVHTTDNGINAESFTN